MSAAATAPEEARTRIDELLAAPVLAVDGCELTGRDLLAAGVVSGRWPRLERELSEGLGLVAAEPPPDAEVGEAVRAFRLDHGLLSAEDLRAWMRSRGLTHAGLKGVSARVLARARGGSPESVAPDEVALALPAEAVCTGALREIGFWLGDRMLSAAIGGASIEPLALERPLVQQLVFDEARTVAGGISPLPGLERAERLAWIAALDQAHRPWEADATGPAEVAAKLHEKELDWCRFDIDELRPGSEGAAAEAARQLAEGVEPAAIAAAASVPLTPLRFLLVDAPPELARALTGAVVGDVIGPWSEEGEYAVARVRERQAPQADDDEIGTRAREDVLADAATRLRAGRVRWYDRA